MGGIVLSFAVGAALAAVYFAAHLRAQRGLLTSAGSLAGLRYAGGLLLRYAGLGLALRGLARWPYLSVVAVVVVFAALFVVLHGLELYRYATTGKLG